MLRGNMLLATSTILIVAVNKIVARTSNMLQAASNLLPATCCSSAQLVAAQHVAPV